MIALDSAAGFMRSLDTAGHIELSSYLLARGAVLRALEAAAQRGAAVHVRLEREPLDDSAGNLRKVNERSIESLRAAGADAALTEPGEPMLHLKAAVTDGVAWLADRNWAVGGAEQILRDTNAQDVAMVSAAIRGVPGSDAHLATAKAGALELEAAVIAGAGDSPLIVESESFGNGPIYNALLHRAQAHLPIRLIVAGREVAEPGNRVERSHLAHLAALGAEVRLGNPKHGDLNEKLAIAGDTAWIGSANATYAGGDIGTESDWGVSTGEKPIVDGLRDAFERNWNVARPLQDVIKSGVLQ